jgi:integrase
MAVLRLRFVDAYRDRHGKQRYYYRRHGLRFALPGEPGEAYFMKAYEDAAARFAGPPTVRGNTPAAGTWDALVVAYYRSPEYLALRPATRSQRRAIMDRWRGEHGAKRVSHLQRRHVQEHMTKAMERGGPWAANNLRSMLKVLCRYALENEWRRDDPTLGVRPVRAKSDGWASWSEADIAKFEQTWAKGTRERLALALLLYTGQRRGDVIGMGRQHIVGKTIRVKQSKTGVSLVIPVHPALRAAIDETPKDNLTFLTTAWGKPFTAAGFGNAFRDWCDEAGLKDRSAHGLRKAAARRLAEAGCSALQIGAITGHRTLKEVSRYTAAADQERLARDAMKKVT